MAEREVASEDKAPGAAAQPAAAPKDGEGTQQLRALIAKGPPEPKAVVEILDTHRGEHDAIFALLHQSFGNAYVQEVMRAMDGLRASIKRREVAAGDPSDPNGGYFVAGQAENGARWRTSGGGFQGSAGKDGLDTTVRVNEQDAVHGKVDKGGAASIAYERDGVSQGELYGRAKGANDWEAGVRRTDKVGDGAITYGARHQQTANGGNDGVTAEYKDATNTIGGTAAVQGGHPVGELHGSHKTAGGQTFAGNASIARTAEGQVETAGASYSDKDNRLAATVSHAASGAVTGSVEGSHKLDDKTTLAGSVARGADATTVSASASEQVTPQLQLSQKLAHTAPDHGEGQTTLSLGDRYKSGSVVQGLDLSLGAGARDYVSATGSAEAQLAPKLYGGVWGSASHEQGKPDAAGLGASLTFTPNEKTALTLAGLIDQSGGLETRLQLDVFKQRIDNIGELSAHKKDALVSLFVSYTQGHQPGMLDDRFGAGQQTFGQDAGGDARVSAGIRIKF